MSWFFKFKAGMLIWFLEICMRTFARKGVQSTDPTERRFCLDYAITFRNARNGILKRLRDER